MISNNNFSRCYGELSLPGIGQVSIIVEGNQSTDPHFHLYDHNNKIDYCIGIYDGLPRNEITYDSYSHGELNNDQLEVIDEWKEGPVDISRGFFEKRWREMAWFFDHSFDSDILDNYDDSMPIPQYHK